MQHFPIPTSYFPGTALFLDDSHDFLLNFVLQLDESVAYRIFDAPRKALDYIHNKHCELELVSKHCLTEYKTMKQEGQDASLHLDLAAIHAQVYNPHRFSEIAVVVVDYAMPGMDGLAFCRHLENTAIKKILLTGQADEKLAIAAFNDGLIQQYVKKSDPHAAQLITKSIQDLQLQYFQARSDAMLRTLSVTSPRCLHDKKFAQFFQELRTKNNIVEYYMVDHAGSFFMLDDDANVSFLLVKHQDDLRKHHDLARAQGAPDALLKALLQGEKIPGLRSTDKSFSIDSQAFVAATSLTFDETYYYAFLQSGIQIDARQQKILSYHRYLEELDAEELLVV